MNLLTHFLPTWPIVCNVIDLNWQHLRSIMIPDSNDNILPGNANFNMADSMGFKCNEVAETGHLN